MSKLFEKIPSIIMIASPPASGKTVLIKYILCDLFKTKKLNYGIVFCPTSFNDSYNFLPQKYVYGQYDENALKHLLNLQTEQIQKNGMNNSKPAFVVFDDCIGSINFKSPLFNKLISTYRQYKLTLIFATQYIYALHSIFRECTTYFITFNQQQKRSLIAIHDTFMGDFDTWDEVKKFINDHCKDYHFILAKTYESYDKKYKFMKVPLINNVKINY